MTTTIVRGWEWQTGEYRIRRCGFQGAFYKVTKQDKWGNWLPISIHGSQYSAKMAIADLTLKG
jgi:hypothetical protein